MILTTQERRENCFSIAATIVLLAVAWSARSAAASPEDGDQLTKNQAAEDNWYKQSFYLLHEDHHTTGAAEVGRDADPPETARLINLSKPDMIQIHAKGNPGWTTYPSKIGHTPPLLKRDVMAVWRGIADQYGFPFSAYYNLGRDGEIMKRRPEWNRSASDGSEIDRALCYHSGVADEYLWPMIGEIMEAYRPDGWWFDGSCFTVRLCYCDCCRSRFKTETGLEPPTKSTGKGWTAYHEMQRQVYRELIHNTAELIHEIDPKCLVAVNWAYSLRMPEKPDSGIAYLTGDIGNRVEGLSAEGHWYDGTGLPFDLMTQLNTHHTSAVAGDAVKRPTFGPKPPVQIQQEMAIVIANGGRFNVWDNPTPESGLTPARHEFLAQHVAPWLATRKRWCLGSKRLPDVSLLNSSAAHYAVTDSAGTVSFNRRDNRIDGATARLPQLHLNYEMVGDWRLHEQDVHSPVLIVEHAKRLADRNVNALIEHVRNGGTLLVTGMGIHHGKNQPLYEVFGIADVAGPKAAERLTANVGDKTQSFEHHLWRFRLTTAEAVITVEDSTGHSRPILTCNQFSGGKAYYFATPLLSAHGDNVVPSELMQAVFEQVAPSSRRLVTTDAPQTVEVVLRNKGADRVLHLVNMAPGDRDVFKAGRRAYVRINSLPPVPACQVSVRTEWKPRAVYLHPQGTELAQWRYDGGRVEVTVPPFEVHQMVVFEK
jgi:hypothetical protein